MDVDTAVEVFIHAFCHIKSRTYPYKPTRVNGLWVMQDDPPRKKSRKIEIIGHGVSPEEAVKAIQEEGLGWHFYCHIYEDENASKAIRDEFKSLGYRAMATEWLFIHDLVDIPIFITEPPAGLVRTQEECDHILRFSKYKTKLLPGSNQFAVWDDKGEYGWVKSIPYGDYTWVSDVYVHAPYRRKGFGSSLMSALLQYDKASGSKASVLLASTAGSKLYPKLGYQQIGVLQMFCPKER